MKTRTIFQAALLFLFTAPWLANAAAGGNPWKYKLPFKSAIVHYDSRGTLKGEETLYVRSSGAEMAKVSRLSGKVMFIPMTEDTVEITTPDWIIKVDNKKKTGNKITNPQKFMLEEYEKLSAGEKATVRKNLEEMGVNMTRQMGGQIQKGASKILGYTCDVVTGMGITVHSIPGTPIALKSKGSMMGVKIDSVATKLEKNVAVPDDVFEAPAGVTITHDKEADEMNREMARAMMNNLKDPEAAKKQQAMADEMQREMARSGQERRAEEEREGEDRDQENEEAPEEEEGRDMNEMMEKGMDALKGIFGN